MEDRTCSVESCERPLRYRSRGWCTTHYERWRKTGSIADPTPTPEFCTIEGCVRPYRARGFCATHWSRWKRDGDPGPAEIEPHIRRFCIVENCDRPRHSNGYCNMHHKRWVSYGDPDVVGKAPRAWRLQVGYSNLHWRVRKIKGRATEHQCAHCGAIASQWAYDHGDPDELTDTDGRPYSMDPTHYIPLCVSCHVKFDREAIR